ncbi:MAG: hypothetical protein DDT34_00755 [Firmicutes bacterium]|nr:hypothetical protein [Bacillota bacterium]
MVKKVPLLFLLAVLLMSGIGSVQATPSNTDLCELTEIDTPGFERMSEAFTLQARSAFRVGNIGTGGDSWVPISSPYNAPRPHLTRRKTYLSLSICNKVVWLQPQYTTCRR